jgi:hypothetical protein
MNWSVIRLLYVHELTMLLRARRTVIMAVILPAVMMPLMLYAQKYSNDRRERTLQAATYPYTITGPLAAQIRKAIADARVSLAAEQDDDLRQLSRFNFVELQSVANPRQSLDANQIQFYIGITLAGSAAQWGAGCCGTSAQGRASGERGLS